MTTLPTEQAVKTETQAAVGWLKTHERIVIVFLILLSVTWIGNKFLAIRADRDRQAVIYATQRLNEQKAHNDQLATQITQLNGQYQNLQVQLAQENAQLSAAMQSRVVVLHDQQQADKTMPLPDLGRRWAQLVQLAPVDISASTAGINVSDTGARQTVEQLEQIPVLQQNLKDETTVADNEKQQVTKANVLITDLNTQVVGLGKADADEESACKAQVASVKADAAKGKPKWFKVGFGIGFVVGFITGHRL